MSRETKRQTTFQGLPINVEIEAGDVKSGTAEDGTAWAHLYQFPYGEIAETKGDDGDPVDVYLGEDEGAAQVHVVHQLRADGAPDEDKVFLGFAHEAAAKQAYLNHGPSFGFGSMDTMTLDQFKHGYLAANRAPLFDSPLARENSGSERYGS